MYFGSCTVRYTKKEITFKILAQSNKDRNKMKKSRLFRE